MKKTLIAFLFIVSISSLVWSADYQKGLDAFNKGDHTTALQEWNPLAEQGDLEAQYGLGYIYAIVYKDYKTALKWWRINAEQGYAPAQYELGLMYREGLGVTKDYQEAMKFFLLSAEQEFFDAMIHIGILYEDGDGVPQDYQQAVEWYKRAAEQGYYMGQYNLSLMYLNGTGVPNDLLEAAKWLRLSAEQGYDQAQYNLSIMYEEGYGVEQDYVVAYMLINIAAMNGNQQIVEERNRLSKLLTQSQLDEAQKKSDECVKKNFKNCLIESFINKSKFAKFSIEGMSLGDSLLDYFSEKEIKDNIVYLYPLHDDIQFANVEFNFLSSYKIYDGIIVTIKNGDEKYQIYNITGGVYYKNNIDYCYKEQEKISEEISTIYTSANKKGPETIKYFEDKSGKSIITSISFWLPLGNYLSVDCSDFSNEMEYVVDNLSVSHTSKILNDWLLDSGIF